MNVAILCEGISDAELLGQYMRNVNHYHLRELHDAQSFDIVSYADTQHIKMYDNKHHHLAIWASHGIWGIPGMVSDIMEGNQLDSGAKRVDAVAIVIDHDSEEDVSDCLGRCAHAQEHLATVDTCAMRGQWICVPYQDSFSNQHNVFLTAIVLPEDTPGAIESFIMQALSGHDDKNELLVKKVQTWLDALLEKTEELPDGYLRKPRDIVKAPLSVYLSVASPNRMLERISDVLSTLDWTKFDLTQTTFLRLADEWVGKNIK